MVGVVENELLEVFEVEQAVVAVGDAGYYAWKQSVFGWDLEFQ